jgi:hypothetical protein
MTISKQASKHTRLDSLTPPSATVTAQVAMKEGRASLGEC